MPHALITGGSRGIGLSIARLLASHSYTITLIGRDALTLSTALSTLPSPMPTPTPDNATPSPPPSSPAHSYIAGDISSYRFWQNIAPSLGDKNKVDVFVNSAGIAQSGALARTHTKEIDQILDTNLKGTILGIRALVKMRAFRLRNARAVPPQEDIETQTLRRLSPDGDGEVGTMEDGPMKINTNTGQEGGEEEEGQPQTQTHSPCIINISSLLGVRGGRGSTVYSASKAGVLGLTRALAAELGPMGIRVNAIVPGYISTDMTAEFGAAHTSRLEKEIPLGRFGTPNEIADAALFLARNEYANNCVINLDGGLSAT